MKKKGFFLAAAAACVVFLPSSPVQAKGEGDQVCIRACVEYPTQTTLPPTSTTVPVQDAPTTTVAPQPTPTNPPAAAPDQATPAPEQQPVPTNPPPPAPENNTNTTGSVQARPGVTVAETTPQTVTVQTVQTASVQETVLPATPANPSTPAAMSIAGFELGWTVYAVLLVSVFGGAWLLGRIRKGRNEMVLAGDLEIPEDLLVVASDEDEAEEATV